MQGGSLTRYIPPKQSGSGLGGLLLWTAQEILKEGLNEGIQELGGRDKVIRLATQSLKKGSQRALKRKREAALDSVLGDVLDGRFETFLVDMNLVPTRPRTRRAEKG